jgi:NADP-dependent 3-hydroxy acid dehydrogenase YdfG
MARVSSAASAIVLTSIEREIDVSYLENKTVVVTGAASGFGRLIAEQSSARGANVVGLDVDGAAIGETFRSLADGRTSALGLEVDVTDPAQLKAAVDTAVEAFGSVDVMVNNAGVMPLAFLADHERALAAWDRCIDINLKGVLHGICAVYDHMVRQGSGHIVNMSSIYGNAGVAGAAVYSATKAAVNALSNALRVESQGTIKVTVVRPTGVAGTGLGATVVDPMSAVPLAAHNSERFLANASKLATGDLSPEQQDRENPAYWRMPAEDVAAQVLYVIDQPLGVAVTDISIRATGEDYVY